MASKTGPYPNPRPSSGSLSKTGPHFQGRSKAAEGNCVGRTKQLKITAAFDRSRDFFVSETPQILFIYYEGFLCQLIVLAARDIVRVQIGESSTVTPYELTLLFTIFVMTHFFYIFNARAFATHRSALHLKGCKGLIFISTLIFVTQVCMVELPGVQRFFNVVILKPLDWLIIIVGSSFVLWIRELWSLLRNKK